MSRKRSHNQSSTSASPVSASTSTPDTGIYESAPIHDRLSIFLAVFSTQAHHLSSPRSLQSHPAVADASHRILAWRKRSGQQTLSTSLPASSSSKSASTSSAAPPILVCGSDDDGEKWAGKRLEKVLTDCGVEGVCVVGRWYGGVMLGPVRFTHIETVAREAVTRFLQEGASGAEAKRMRISSGVADDRAPALTPHEEQQAKSRLARILTERDGSIVVLRGLLADKQRLLRDLESNLEEDKTNSQAPTTLASENPASTPVSTSTSPSKSRSTPSTTNYDTLPLPRLKALEKARDATLTWILKQIEDVEKKIALTEQEQDLERCVDDGAAPD